LKDPFGEVRWRVVALASRLSYAVNSKARTAPAAEPQGRGHDEATRKTVHRSLPAQIVCARYFWSSTPTVCC